MDSVIAGIIGIVIGAAAGFFGAMYLNREKEKTAQELAEELYRKNESFRKDDRDNVLTQMKASFGDLSLDALKKIP